MQNEEIVVQKSLMPFERNFKTLHLENCKTLKEIVDKTIPYNMNGARLVVTVDNEIIDSDSWDGYKLRKGQIVGLNFIPTGGGGGGKNPLATIVTVALIAATVYTGGLAGLAAGNLAYGAGYGTIGAGGFGGLAGAASYLATGAVYVAGSMLTSITLSAIMSTPKQSSSDDSGIKSINASNNSIDQYGIIPVNLGKNRMFPKQAALPFNETSGLDQYVRQLFTYGYGKVVVTERKIGETSLSEYEGVEISDRLNADLKEGTSLYTNDVYQENLSVDLKTETGYVTRTTQRNTDECEITLMFPYGLYHVYGSKMNKKASLGVAFGVSYAITGTEEWSTEEEFSIVDLYTKTLIKTKTLKFPKQGQYDVRLRRISVNGDTYRNFSDSIYSSLKSISYVNPINFANISGTALRIKATDQLSGSISNYNVLVSTLVKSYNPNTNSWVDNVESSNPADLYRYVLQSPAFAKALDDKDIDLEKLAEWWKYCDSLKLTYNRIIDYETSVDDVLNDICAAGVATLSKANNIYSVIIDNERPVVKGLVTPRNSWDYTGNINYPEIPHALRIEFRNADKNYETDERIVYADGYDENNATLYERLQFESCTNADLAYWYGRRYYATALLQPETHTFKMDFENLTFNRGDRISLVNDVILVGVGQGRIKKLLTDDNKNVTGFIIDDILDIPSVNNLGVRIRDNAGKGIDYYLLQKVTGQTSEFSFATPLSLGEAPVVGSLCAFVEDGKELDLIISGIQEGSNNSATITAIDYAPARFDPIGEIPPFESNITAPTEFTAPLPPILNGEIKSDESVMLKNSDGSLISTMVIPLTNRNDNDVLPIIYIRITGGSQWYTPSILKRDTTELIITGLEETVRYDIKIRYQRQSGLQLLSTPLILNNVNFIGGSNPPKKVQNFRVTIINGMALFEWSPNDDIDISHYVIRYSASTEDVTWESAQIVMDKITSTSITNIIHKGVYLIKAVDMLGNTSEEPTVIFSDETGAFKNVVEELIQQPNWPGVMENVYAADDMLNLEVGEYSGFYYFDPDVIDLGDIYECSLTANVKSVVRKRDRIRDVGPIREVGLIRNIGEGINTDGNWGVELEMSLSNDGVTWSEWSTFIAAKQTFRACKFRLRIYTDSENITPLVSVAQVNIDMPDRYESGEDIEIINAEEGASVIYENAFRNNPSVNITLQDASIDDKIEYIEKNNKGFTIKVFNGTLNSYVKRSFDYLSAGYGKVLKGN